MTLDTLALPLPCDQEAERAVIGAVMLSPEAADRLVPMLTVSDFWGNERRNGDIWGAVLRIHDRRQRVDLLTVTHDLAQMEILPDIGGREYLNQCLASCPSPIGSEFYADIVHRDSVYRQIIQGASNLMAAAYSAPADPQTILSRADEMLARIRGESGPRAISGADLMPELVLQTKKFAENPGALPGIETPWGRINRILGGVRAKSLITVGAATSIGKSLFLQNMAWHFAVAKRPVLVVTTEMSAAEWQLRLAHMVAGFDPEEAKTVGRVTPSQHESVEAALVEMAAWPLWYVEGSLTITELKAEVRREKAQHRIEGVIVDHFGDVEGRGQSEREQMQSVCKGLKLDVCMGEGLWTLMSSHVNREATRARVDKEGHESAEWLRLHHLYGSSAIEKYSDAVLLLTPTDYNGTPMTDRQVSDSPAGSVERLSVEVAKNRKGRKGRVPMYVKWAGGGGRIREVVS